MISRSIWLSKQDPNCPRYGNAAKYFAQLVRAWPEWCPASEFKAVYAEARRIGGHVDHIVPLRSPIVCGLHVPWNLQALPVGVNIVKSNHMWPGHPCEPLALDLPHEPHQLALCL